MDAITRQLLWILTGLVLGLFTAFALYAVDLLNITAGTCAVIVFGFAVWLIVPGAPERSTNLSPLSPGQTAMPHTRFGNEARLDDWVSERASRGGPLIPTVELEAEASHALGRMVGQGPLRDAIDRHMRRVQVEGFHRMRRTLVRT